MNKIVEMFEQLKNIETSFKHIRLFSAVLVIGTICSQCFFFYFYIKQLEKERGRIYIIANGAAIEAFSSNIKDNIPVEGKDHIIRFHNYFFNLSPDEKAIQNNIIKALYLADRSAKDLYDDWREKGYYSNIISANASQELSVDSVVMNFQNNPYYFRFYGSVRIVRMSAVLVRSLVSEGYLRRIERSEFNSHGFLIEKFKILENTDLSNEKR